MYFPALLASVVAVAAAPTAGAEPSLPDLTQGTPYELGVMTDGRRSHLGFASVVHNYGDGSLRIEGRRASTSEPFMTADQVVDSSDAAPTRVRGVGRLRYVDSGTHRHWHYLRFDTYSLRRTNGRLVRPDRKTGFCLGDRLEAPPIGRLPAKPPRPEYTTNCGYDEPDLLEMDEGISVGYGDDYVPQLEGQYVELTGLRPGRYVLVHRVNPDGALREKSLENNAASVLIDLRWKRRVPRVTQVARCPLSATCPVAPELTNARARQLALRALRRAYPRRQVTGIECATGACTARVDGRTATVGVSYAVARGRLYWRYSVRGDGLPVRRGRLPVAFGRKGRVPVQSFPPRVAARAG